MFSVSVWEAHDKRGSGSVSGLREGESERGVKAFKWFKFRWHKKVTQKKQKERQHDDNLGNVRGEGGCEKLSWCE